jgi:RimJ/RimL family protein N-acetyltransferase
MDVTSLPVTTERLLLRLFTSGDADDMHAYQGLASVARYLYRPPRTRDACEKIIGQIASATRWAEDGDRLTLAVCWRESPQAVGEITITLASAHARQAEIGWLLNPEYQGRGYASEAARAVAALAFDELGVHRLFARLDVENTGSVRVCERLGMRREAHLVENDLDGERWGSEYIYAALAHELRR